jgi:hypothetical protein
LSKTYARGVSLITVVNPKTIAEVTLSFSHKLAKESSTHSGRATLRFLCLCLQWSGQQNLNLQFPFEGFAHRDQFRSPPIQPELPNSGLSPRAVQLPAGPLLRVFKIHPRVVSIGRCFKPLSSSQHTYTLEIVKPGTYCC